MAPEEGFLRQRCLGFSAGAWRAFGTRTKQPCAKLKLEATDDVPKWSPKRRKDHLEDLLEENTLGYFPLSS